MTANYVIINNVRAAEFYTDKEVKEAFADSLKEMRAYCKVSLIKLAEDIDIPNQSLSAYENCTRVPSFLQALKIATYFGLTVEDFVLCGLGCNKLEIWEIFEKKRQTMINKITKEMNKQPNN